MANKINKVMRKGVKLAKVLANSGYRRAFQSARVAAAIEHERLLKTLNCKTVVDIGANGGQFALVSRACFGSARIISFEPLSQPADRFRRVFRDDPKVILHQFAVGPDTDDGVIHVAAEDDSSSLLPASPLQTSLFAGTHEVRTEKISVKQLDEVICRQDITPPAMLKVDVQGYELKTLQACSSLLDAFHYLYIECSFVELYLGQSLADDVIAFVRPLGFRLAGVYNVMYAAPKRAIQADLLFVAGSGAQISSAMPTPPTDGHVA